MKNYIIGIIVVVLVVLVGKNLWNRSDVPTEKAPIKIGASLAVSGSLASIGEEEKRGLEMGVAEVNANGGIDGRKLELIVEDNQGDAKVAVSSVQKLFNVDNVDVLVTAFTHITNAVKSLAIERGTPMIYVSSVPDMAKESRLFFKDYMDNRSNSNVLSERIVSLGFKEVKLLSEEGDSCKVSDDFFLNKESKVKVVARESFVSGTTDFKTPLLKLRDVYKGAPLVVCAWRDEVRVMPQMKQLGMLSTQSYHQLAPFLAPAKTPEMYELFSEGKVVSSWYGFAENNKEKASDAQKKFFADYETKYGTKATSDAAYTYDDTKAIAIAVGTCLEKNNAFSVDCFLEEFGKTNIDGASGSLTFDSDRSSKRRSILMEATKDGWKELVQ